MSREIKYAQPAIGPELPFAADANFARGSNSLLGSG